MPKAYPQNMEELLAAARRLPRDARAELAQMLLRESPEPYGQVGLGMLRGMSAADLVTLSGATLSPARQQRLKALLRKNTRAELGVSEQHELDALLEETDRVALLKAKAAYTLAQLGGPRPAAI